MKPEQALRLLIKDHLPGKHWRIENAVGTGMPDIYGVCRICDATEDQAVFTGTAYWLELKVSERHGYLEIDRLVTPLQRKWHWDAAQFGQRVFVLIRCDNWLELVRCTGKDTYALVLRIEKAGSWDWPLFTAKLTHG
jgi:hypothetical protein